MKKRRKREFSERQIICIFNTTAAVVGDTGGCNAYGCDICHGNTLCGCYAAAKLCHVVNDKLGRALCQRGYALLFDYIHVLIHKSCGNICSAEVDTDPVHYKVPPAAPVRLTLFLGADVSRRIYYTSRSDRCQ